MAWSTISRPLRSSIVPDTAEMFPVWKRNRLADLSLLSTVRIAGHERGCQTSAAAAGLDLTGYQTGQL